MQEDKGAQRQTLSYLRTMLQERGIRPKNKLGQNFLIDLNLLDLIVREAELSKDDLVIEVGSGTGGLTARLTEEAGVVLSIELDSDFALMTKEAVDEKENVVLHQGDILHNKNELNRRVLSILDELREKYQPAQLKLVSNLPYSVATPVISNFLLSELPIERMVVTVQWEIAERFVAMPSTKEYGALSILIQSLADVEIVRRLPPSVFWPQPKVDSGIVLIRPNAEKRAHVGEPQRLRNFLRELYVHKRKNLRGALASIPSIELSKAEIDEKLQSLQLEGTTRAETLSLEEHLLLSRVFQPEK